MVNVRDIMTMDMENVKDIETVVKPRTPDMHSAFRRLDELKVILDRLAYTINDTNVENTEASWHLAYAQLTGAFKECMKEEKKIISES